MADLGTHAALLAANLATPFTSFLCAHRLLPFHNKRIISGYISPSLGMLFKGRSAQAKIQYNARAQLTTRMGASHGGTSWGLSQVHIASKAAIANPNDPITSAGVDSPNPPAQRSASDGVKLRRLWRNRTG